MREGRGARGVDVSDDLKWYMKERGLNNKEAGKEFGVHERTVRYWKSGHTPLPADVMRIIRGDYSSNMRISYEQMCTTLYKLIQNMKDMELEITELRRVVQKENGYQNGMNLFQHRP